MKGLFFIPIALLLIFGLLMGSCTKASPATSLPPSTPSPTPLTSSDIISRSSQKMGTVNSFHFVLDHTGGGTPIAMGIEMTKAVGDIVRPDKLQTTISGTVMGMSLEVQVITLGDKTYMTNPLTSKWELLSNDFKVLSVFDPSTGVAAIMKGITGPTKLSDEEIGGSICYHIGGSIDSGNLSPITGSSVQGVTIATEVWITKNDFLPLQIKLIGKITETEKEGIVRMLSLSNFNQEVKIESPQ